MVGSESHGRDLSEDRSVDGDHGHLRDADRRVLDLDRRAEGRPGRGGRRGGRRGSRDRAARLRFGVREGDRGGRDRDRGESEGGQHRGHHGASYGAAGLDRLQAVSGSHRQSSGLSLHDASGGACGKPKSPDFIRSTEAPYLGPCGRT
ncbi:hypothetical protein F0U44_10565 [Nocardioides humilatus]|uniref:Uncharacterized protein n=1 Tax=Nocardioides humilatus TaxID=2607660 RepID=A0A5B1LDV2_9ACTN|nr:hypothetical protein F0U44_10565 [Nocardioides humilatus]